MRSLMRKIMRDRFLWFVLAGIVLFAAEWFYEERRSYLIEIDLPLVEKLAAQWRGQLKIDPTPVELDALVEGYIREEIMVREAKRLGLDGDDIIIRRRLSQKLEFFMGGAYVPETPSEETLRAYFAANGARYEAPARLSFRHIYVRDKSEIATIKSALNDKQSAWRALGAPFMLQREYGAISQKELQEIFGNEFADALFEARARRDWFGALRSAFGWHLVQIASDTKKQLPEFADIAERLNADWQNEQAARAYEQEWEALRGKYRVQLQPVEALPELPPQPPAE